MLSNINDIYREKIYTKEFVEIFEYFSSLDEDKQEKLLRFILMDNYKINCFNNNKVKIDSNSINPILISCLDNAKVFKEILKQASSFYEMDYFSKSLLIEDMKIKKLDANIVNISKKHLLDILTYQILDELKLYQEYYQDFMNKNQDNLLGQELLINYISLRVLELKNNDENKYEKFLLELIKTYYKWIIFIKEHEGEYLLNFEDFIYIDKIENLEKTSLINYIEGNLEFLNFITGEYLHYKTADIEIKEELVDYYFNKECDEKIKIKLKIKNQIDN